MSEHLHPNKGLEVLYFCFYKIKCCVLLKISYSEIVKKIVIFFSTSYNKKIAQCRTWQIELIVQ